MLLQVATDFYDNSDPEDIDIDLNEDTRDDDDDEASDDGYMDLSEVLARQVRKEKAAEAKALGKEFVASTSKNITTIQEEDEENLISFKPGSLGSAEDDEEESDMEEEEEGDSDEDLPSNDSDNSDEDEDDAEALQKLGNIVSRLGSDKKRAAADDPQELADEANERDLQRKKRKLMLARERNEALPEGEFSAGTASGKLTIDALLSTLNADQASALKQSLKPLIAASKSGSTTVEDANNAIEAELYRLNADEQALLSRERRKEKSNPLKAPGALPAPLAPLHQAKIERQAAKEKQDEKIREWDETVKYMKGVSREGEDDPQNRLDLKSLNDSQGKGKGVTSAELVAKFTVSSVTLAISLSFPDLSSDQIPSRQAIWKSKCRRCLHLQARDSEILWQQKVPLLWKPCPTNRQKLPMRWTEHVLLNFDLRVSSCSELNARQSVLRKSSPVHSAKLQRKADNDKLSRTVTVH